MMTIFECHKISAMARVHFTNLKLIVTSLGVEGVVLGLEGIDLADRCMLTKL
jgi:hypothetical protein